MQVWENSSLEDTIRLKALHALVWEKYLYAMPDSANYYAQQAVDLSREKGHRKYEAKAYNTQGMSFLNKGEYEEALAHFEKSLDIAEQISDRKRVASVYNNIAIAHRIQGNYTLSLEYSTKSIKIYKEVGNRRGVALAYNNIGIMYREQKEFGRAIEYHDKSLKIFEDLGDEKRAATILNNKGNIYNDLGEYDRALDSYRESAKIYENIADKKGIALTLNNIGSIYFIQGEEALKNKKQDLAFDKFEIAYEYTERSRKKDEEIDNKLGMATSLNQLGAIDLTRARASIHTEQNDYFLECIRHCKEALRLAEESGAVIQVRDAASTLYEANRDMGNYPAALEMHELFVSMRDSIVNLEVQKVILRQAIQHEYDEQALADSLNFARQREIDQINHNKNQITLAALFSLVILVVFGFYLRNRILRKAEREKLIQKIDVLKAEATIQVAARNQEMEIERAELNKERIEARIKATLNQTDWNILTELFQNPLLNAKEIGDKVSLSKDGVYSSLKKMYRLFELEKKRGENRRIELVMLAIKFSEPQEK